MAEDKKLSKDMKVEEAIAQIKTIEHTESVMEFIKGDERTTVQVFKGGSGKIKNAIG